MPKKIQNHYSSRKGSGGSKSSGKSLYARKKNPKRGAPAMLLSCETGREVKCLRDGMDILFHYYHLMHPSHSKASNVNAFESREDQDSHAHVTVKHDGADGDTQIHLRQRQETDHEKGGKTHEEAIQKDLPLSLDQEIALLKAGASVDTVLSNTAQDRRRKTTKEFKKCRGEEIFQLYETGCRGSVVIMFKKSSSDEPEPDVAQKEDKEGISCFDQIHTSSLNPTMGHGTENDEISHPPTKKLKIEFNLQPLWDPVETIQRILNDITRKDKDKEHILPPHSRYVTRMIPLQTTCFASMEEVKSSISKVIQRYLFPVGVQVYESRNSNDSKSLKIPTFKVEFKRRNCSHINRADVIEAVITVLNTMTLEYLQTKSDPDYEKNDTSSVFSQMFAVDLSNPDYTVSVEICRTLCGISVIKDIVSFKNFNVMEVRESMQAQNNAESEAEDKE